MQLPTPLDPSSRRVTHVSGHTWYLFQQKGGRKVQIFWTYLWRHTDIVIPVFAHCLLDHPSSFNLLHPHPCKIQSWPNVFSLGDGFPEQKTRFLGFILSMINITHLHLEIESRPGFHTVLSDTLWSIISLRVFKSCQIWVDISKLLCVTENDHTYNPDIRKAQELVHQCPKVRTEGRRPRQNPARYNNNMRLKKGGG